MLDLVALIIISLISIFLLTLLLVQRRSRIKILEKYIQSEIQKAIILKKLEELTEENELKNIENSDGFLKFVSDSRDWAFKYIEDIQVAFKKFDDKIGLDLDYADAKESLGVEGPDSDTLVRISQAYKELKKMLPKDMVD